jgi:NADH:ubiquinone oxidoreductase subunit 4 (subunit M)
MIALAVLSLLAAGLFLPLYPLSIGANLLLKRQPPLDAADPLASPAVKVAAILLMPLAGVALLELGLHLAGDSAGTLATTFAIWGGLTSILYAFRLLSARDGKIWIAQMYTSALALVWVGLVHGVPPLLPALGLALSLLPLTILLSSLTRRFGIARVGLFPGLSSRMPVFSGMFVAAVLVAVAVPFSPAFFAIADLAFGGVGDNELITLAPVSLSWLLWTWAGINLITGFVFGTPRDDLAYVDLERRTAMLYGTGMLALSLFGIFLVEGVL